MKWRWILILVAPALLAVLAATAAVMGLVPIRFTVTAYGRILPAAYVRVTAARNGRITRLHPAGPVKKGEILLEQSAAREHRELAGLRSQLELLQKALADETARLDRTRKSAALAADSAALAVKQAQADLDNTAHKIHPVDREIEKRRLERRRRQADLAHKEYKILQTLAKEQSVPQQEVVRGETADAVARLQFEEEQWSDKKSALARSDTLRTLRAALEQRRNELEQARLLAIPGRRTLLDLQVRIASIRSQIEQVQADIAAKTITAPDAGEWMARQVTRGEYAATGAFIGIFAANRRLRFVGMVRETQAPWVRPSAPARIRLTAFPYLKYGRLRARVTHLEPALPGTAGKPGTATPGGGYRVELQLDPIENQPYTPLPGLAGKADIQVFRGTLLQYLLANPAGTRTRRFRRKSRPRLLDLLHRG